MMCTDDRISNQRYSHDEAAERTYNILFRSLVIMFIFDGFFTWLTISVYSFHVLELGFSPLFLAVAYTSGELCRIIVSVWSRYYAWYIPVFVMTAAVCVTIPAAIDDTTQISMYCLGMYYSQSLSFSFFLSLSLSQCTHTHITYTQLFKRVENFLLLI